MHAGQQKWMSQQFPMRLADSALIMCSGCDPLAQLIRNVLLVATFGFNESDPSSIPGMGSRSSKKNSRFPPPRAIFPVTAMRWATAIALIWSLRGLKELGEEVCSGCDPLAQLIRNVLLVATLWVIVSHFGEEQTPLHLLLTTECSMS